MPLFRFIRRLLPIVLAAASVQACVTAHTYSAKPITATVVDAETGEPLEGVNVVAHWVLRNRTTWGGVGDLELLETVTGKSGQLHFEGWDGKTPWSLGPYETRLSNEDPAMIFFKSGYKPGGAGNHLQPERLRDEDHIWERYSDWDGKVIKLEKFKGNPESYGSAVDGIMNGVGSGIQCPWKKTPRIYASLIKERQRLDSLGVRNYLPTLALMESNFKNSGCGSARDFFGEYLK
jgi:hypothetical protein